jgi:hypothetical protein
MEYRRLGSTGLEVSPVCLGTWRFGKESGGVVETDRADAHELLDAYADRGGNFIDTANGYGGGKSEAWIGEWLEDRDREDFVIASKCFWSTVSRFQENLSRKNVRAEVEGSTASARITSTSSTCIASTTRRQSSAPSGPWTTSSARGRSTTSVSRPVTPGSSPRASGRPT